MHFTRNKDNVFLTIWIHIFPPFPQESWEGNLLWLWNQCWVLLPLWPVLWNEHQRVRARWNACLYKYILQRKNLLTQHDALALYFQVRLQAVSLQPSIPKAQVWWVGNQPGVRKHLWCSFSFFLSFFIYSSFFYNAVLLKCKLRHLLNFLILSCRTWGKWAGPADDIYSVMKYEHGTGCWQGPSRSTTVSLHTELTKSSALSWVFSFQQSTCNRSECAFQVKLICGKETTVTSTSEPSRCEYLMEFITPAVCQDPPSDDLHHLEHEEL